MEKAGESEHGLISRYVNPFRKWEVHGSQFFFASLYMNCVEKLYDMY